MASPYCQASPRTTQQQHSSTAATIAIMSVVLDFLGSSGAGVSGGEKIAKKEKTLKKTTPQIGAGFPPPPAGRCRDHGTDGARLGDVHCPCNKQASCQCQNGTHVCHHVRAGGEGDRSGSRADEGLDQVIDM